jgi:hypothetical protein
MTNQMPVYKGTKALVGGVISGLGTVAGSLAATATGGVTAAEWIVSICAGVVVACAAATGVYTTENKPK